MFGILTALSVNGVDNLRELDIASKLDEVSANLALPPLERLNILDTIINESKQKEDNTSLFNAVLLKAEILVKMEHLSEAEQIITRYENLASKDKDNIFALRFALLRLSISDAKGSSTNINRIHKDILERVADVDDEYIKAFAYINIGNSQYVNSINSAALTNYRKGLVLSKKIDDQLLISEALSGLGNVFSEINDIDTAIENFTQAIAIRTHLGDEFTVSILLFNLGKTLFDHKRYDEAEAALNKSASISEKLNDEVGLLWTRHIQANINLRQGKFEKSLHYHQLAAKSFEETSNTRMAFQAQLGIFDAKLGLNDVEGAKQALSKAIKLSKEHNQIVSGERHILQRQAYLAAAKSNFQEAYETHKSYSQSLIEFFEGQRKQNTEDLRVKYDIESAEARNALLAKENELKNLKIEQQKKERYLWGILTILSFVIVFFILHRQITLRNQYKTLTLLDELTQAPNRRAIMKIAQQRFESASKEKAELLIGIIDLDHFKKINDTFGHDVGDEVLKSFAIACQKTFRHSDSFGRYGGEEWLFVIPNMKDSAVEQLFNRLKDSLNSMEISGLPDSYRLTFSMGVATYHHGDTLQTMINRADENLYKAKHAGRNIFCQ